MSAVATGNFILTGDNALLLTTFALAFSPVDPFSVAAFAALRVSFPGACPGKDDISYFYEETTFSLRAAREAYMEGIHVGFGRRICTDASSKPLPIATRIVCGLFIALAQIRRSKLRCTCHGAIFERVLVRRTQEYKSIPRTTSRKSPEIAHVRRHGSLSCMPPFSPRAPLSLSFYSSPFCLTIIRIGVPSKP